MRPLFVLPGLVALLAAAACTQNSNSQTTSPVDLGMTSSLTAYYNSEQLTLYEVQTPVQLPVKQPSAGDLNGLAATPAGTGYPRMPWLTADNEQLEVHYIITNADTSDHVAYLLIDPWNEFVRWNPGVTVVNDETAAPNYGYDLPFLVKAMSRVEGTITQDDMKEIAIKLASVENLLGSAQTAAALAATMDGGMNTTGFNPTGTANNIFNPQNRSNGGDPLYTPWIPSVIAGLTGFDLGLRTTESANLAVEITIDITDVDGKHFVQQNSSSATIGLPPATLSPPGAVF